MPHQSCTVYTFITVPKKSLETSTAPCSTSSTAADAVVAGQLRAKHVMYYCTEYNCKLSPDKISPRGVGRCQL